MNPHNTIAARPMTVAACDATWPSKGARGLLSAESAELAGEFWFMFTVPRLPIDRPPCVSSAPHMSDSGESDAQTLNPTPYMSDSGETDTRKAIADVYASVSGESDM